MHSLLKKVWTMIKKRTLKNGIRIATESAKHVESVCIGVWVFTGSRNENKKEAGISHFLEHMLFKGTETRTAANIAAEFDFIGGQVNAFTEKEYTCYYAKVLSEHLPKAVDIMADMLLNSKFDPAEMELERNVVFEEIKRYEDSPDDLVHDYYAQSVWQGHPLANPIIGTKKAIDRTTRTDMIDYMNRTYTPDNILIAAAGNLDHKEVVSLVDEKLGGMSGKGLETDCGLPSFITDSKMESKKTEQVHFCIGSHGFSHTDEDRYPMAIIDTTLGGGMSSRLFQEIREKRGLAYSIGSYSSSYRECGLFTVFGGTSIKNIEQVADLVKKEFQSVLKKGITDEELTRSKNQIKGALFLSQENMSNRMIRLGKSLLYMGRVVTPEEIVEKISKVTRKDLARVADQVFNEKDFPLVAIGPFKKKGENKS